MTNLIDITDIIASKRKESWYRRVMSSIKFAKTDADKLYWTEIKLAIQFEEYYEKNGEYHPEDPLNMDTDCYLKE